MIKVEALNTYKERNIEDEELKRIPKEGERWEVSEKRLEVLLGKNRYNVAFVKVIEDTKENKSVKKTKNLKEEE